MAEQVTVSLVDDLDGSQAEETVEFALDGVHYAIDLNADHAETLRQELSSYTQHGTRLGGRKKSRASRTKKTSATTRREPTTSVSNRERNQAIRTWAQAAGYEVSDRGRIPAEIVDAYDKTH